MKRSPRQRDKQFLAALHHLPCLRCGSRTGVEAAHIRLTSKEWEERTGVRTGAGGAEKPSDRWCLPLCSRCHRTGPDAEHAIGTRRFYEEWGIDPHEIANDLYAASPNVEAMIGVAARVLFFNPGATNA